MTLRSFPKNLEVGLAKLNYHLLHNMTPHNMTPHNITLHNITLHNITLHTMTLHTSFHLFNLSLLLTSFTLFQTKPSNISSSSYTYPTILLSHKTLFTHSYTPPSTLSNTSPPYALASSNINYYPHHLLRLNHLPRLNRLIRVLKVSNYYHKNNN